MGRVWRYLRLARPHFLLGGAILFALGARWATSIHAGRYAIAQCMVTAVQLTAQLANEYADAESDALVVHRTLFSGGSGVISSGALSRRAALTGSRITTVVAVGAITATATFSVAAAVLGMVALGFAWAYSIPPPHLLGTGWGEAATSLVVAGLVPITGAAAQGAFPDATGWWAIAALVPLHLAMILCFELPDIDGDAASGKRVLAVRMGRPATHRLIVATAAVGTALLLAGAVRGNVLAGLAAVGAGSTAALAVVVGIQRDRWGLVTSAAVGGFVAVVGVALAAA